MVPARVTAVIPCFNQGKFLAECLDSLRAQRLADWHAVVVDDASTDGETPALCDAQAGPQVTVLHLPTNHGRSLARNVGIQHAKSEAILSLDADDAIEPEHLSQTVPLLLAKEDIGIVYTDYQRFGGRTDQLKGEPFVERNLYFRQYIYAGSLFRRSAWARTRGYSDDFRIGNEDYDFWLTLVEAGYRGVYVPRPLFRYRSHALSWTSSGCHGDDRVYRSRLLLLEHHRAGFERHGATRKFLADTYRAEAQRLAAAGDRQGAAQLWCKVAELQPWNLRAQLGARL